MYTLSNNSIDRISEEITSILKKERISSRSCTEIRLVAEELLLQYQEKFGADTELALLHIKRFGKTIVTLKVRCESFDPADTISDEDFWLWNALRTLDYVPTWRYKNGCNEICFSVKRGSRLPSWASTVIACGLGIICGFVARLLSADTLSVLLDTVLNPVTSAIMGFLGAVSGMLIALSILSGIVGMGNVATLNRLGEKLIGHIMLWMAILTALLVLILGLIFPVSGGGGGSFDFGSLWDMLLGIIPGSLIDPFNSGNTLQILFLSIVVGIIILRSVDKLESVVKIVEGLNLIIQDLMMLILKVLPLVIFISLLDLFSGSSDIHLGAVYKFPLVLFILSFAWLGLSVLRVCVKQKVKLTVLLKKLLPAFLIALSTSSSNAALTTSMETCEKRLGIHPGLVRAGVPLSHSINQPAGMILLMVGTLCMAQMFSVDISWTSLISMMLAVFLLTIASPPVPGAFISIFTLLFTLYGVPLEAISFIISLDVITDRIATPITVSCSQLELIQVADKTGNLNKDILRSDNG